MNSTGIHARFKSNLSISSANIQTSRAVKFMGAASAVACAIALTSAAAAQSVPGACAAPSPLASGSTILCVSPDPIAGPVLSPEGDGVEDLTVVVGSATQATTLTAGTADAAVNITGSGDQTVNVVNVGSVIDGGTGTGVSISVSSGGTGDLTVNSEGTISGGDYGVSAINNGSGGISITTADVSSGEGIGIDALRNSSAVGDIVIDSTAGAVFGQEQGISASNGSRGGRVSITTADVTSTNGQAIRVFSRGDEGDAGDIVVNTVAGTVTAYGEGISVVNRTDGSVSITTADVVSEGDDAIYVRSGYGGEDNSTGRGGDIVINTVAGTVTGGNSGIAVLNGGAGGVSITTADVVGNDGAGIYVRSGYGGEGEARGGDIVINTEAGSITGHYDGIFVEQDGPGGVSITTANVEGIDYSGIAVFAGSASGDIVINTEAGTVTGYYNGIYVDSDGDGAISITTADVVSFDSDGIEVDSDSGEGGAITINSVAGTVTGDSDAVRVDVNGTGTISITTADVVGLGGDGIDVDSDSNYGGLITINSLAGTVRGDDNGIEVDSYSSGISIRTADVFADSTGIAVTLGESGAFDSAGDVVINTEAGSITGGEAGIAVENNGTGGVFITTADVTGGEAGVAAVSYWNSAGITINTVSGTVVGGEYGIRAADYGGAISITTADVTGGDVGESSGFGILAISQGEAEGSITIDSRAGTVTGGAIGILAYGLGGGTVTITSGDVTGGAIGIAAVTGLSSEGGIVINSVGTVSGEQYGIYAEAGSGDIVITANNVTSAGVAISATNEAPVMYSRAIAPVEGAGSLLVNTTGTVVGGSAGILLTNAGAGRSTVNNSGTVSATDGPAILALGAPATINNGGTINGFVTLTDGDDVFNNTGTFNAGAGNDFGAGTDVFNNSGTVAVTSQAGLDLAGLEGFNNSGLVDLRNGQTGTVLTLPGDYVGSGNALLAVDVENLPSGATTDFLVITGAATGQTGIVVNVLGSAGNELGLENLVLVSAGAGSTASAFTVATGLEEQGFLRIGVKFDEAANNYVLVLGPSLAAQRTSLYAEGMRNLWYKTADSWSRHMASVRNTPVEPGATYWISAVGEFTERDNMRSIAFNDSIEIHDLGYNQDYFGAQLGVDLNGGQGFTFGVTGGYLSSAQKFNASSDQVKYNAVNVGAYAGFTNGIVFANALAKYDRVWADARSIGGRFNETLEGGVYGVRGEVGLTFGDAANSFYAEPAVSLSYIQSNLDRLANAQGSVDFDEDEGLLGKVGARVGYAGFTGTSLYLGANLVREFAGNDRIDLQTGGRDFSLSNFAERNYAETMVGVNLGDPSGVASGVFELGYSDGGDRKGFGGSATINFKF